MTYDRSKPTFTSVAGPEHCGWVPNTTDEAWQVCGQPAVMDAQSTVTLAWFPVCGYHVDFAQHHAPYLGARRVHVTPPGIPPARLLALVDLLWPDEITPIARMQLRALAEEYQEPTA